MATVKVSSRPGRCSLKPVSEQKTRQASLASVVFLSFSEFLSSYYSVPKLFLHLPRQSPSADHDGAWHNRVHTWIWLVFSVSHNSLEMTPWLYAYTDNGLLSYLLDVPGLLYSSGASRQPPGLNQISSLLFLGNSFIDCPMNSACLFYWH